MKKIFLLIFLLSFPLFLTAREISEEDIDNGMTIKIIGGHRFRVPVDMPIEKKDGIIAPMDLYEYLAMKFKKINTNLNKIEESLKDIQKEINLLKEKDKIGDSG